MALASKTARLALGSAVIDAQYLADSVIFMNSKYGVQGMPCHLSVPHRSYLLTLQTCHGQRQQAVHMVAVHC